MGDKDKRPVTIRADKLTKTYGDFAAISEVSFEVRKGTVAAFLGPNGAGKSTTMRILTGYLAPTSGRAEVLGLDPSDGEQRRELARRLGYLPEAGPLYADMTPVESLNFFADVRGVDSPAKAIARVIEQCSIGEVRHKPIYKLSKGFRQRVGMAQTLLHDPEVIIMDEPTSGLDPLQIREVRKLIRELGKTKTLLLSTHILQEVSAMADEIIMVSEGRIVFRGDRDLLTQPGYRTDGKMEAATIEERFYALATGGKTGKKKEVA